MRRVILESPYAGDRDRNLKYARLCVLDSLNRGEAPLASHLLYTQMLDDDISEQRKMGIAAGHAWIPCAEAIVVYEDYGISPGMAKAIADAGIIPVEHRTIMSEENDMVLDRACADNPELPREFVKDILETMADPSPGVPYVFGTEENDAQV